MNLLHIHQAQAHSKAYLASLHDRKLTPSEAKSMNEATQALNSAPVPEAPKPA